MKTDIECMPCIIRQCMNTLDVAGFNENFKREAIRELLVKLSEINYDLPPSYNSDIAYIVARKITKIDDIYYKLKKESNRLALDIFPELKEIVGRAPDRLYAGIKVAVEGNVIDFGINLDKKILINFNKVLENIKNTQLAIDDYKEFRESLDKATNVLYISDNAGELVFDRVFIKEIIKQNKNVVLSVKSGPIINDATKEDAIEVGLDNLVKIIETGNNCIGINFENISDEFLKEFKKADLIICKGQGNFETLDEIDANTFFILKAKCEKVARELGVNYLDVVLVKRRKEWGRKKV